MIFQENDFLKTYDDMSKLWEDASIFADSDSESAVEDPQFSFKNIIIKAAAYDKAKKLTSEEIDYWSKLKYLVRSKFNRYANDRALWYTKLLNAFIKTYCMENLIANAVFGNVDEGFKDLELQFCLPKRLGGIAGIDECFFSCQITSCMFNDKLRDQLYNTKSDWTTVINTILGNKSKDSESASADYQVEATFSYKVNGKEISSGPYSLAVECKSAGYDKYPHKAPLILFYEKKTTESDDAETVKTSGQCHFKMTKHFADEELLSGLGLPDNIKSLIVDHWMHWNILINGKEILSFNPINWDTQEVSELFGVQGINMKFNDLKDKLKAIDAKVSKDGSDLNKPIITYLSGKTNEVIRQINIIAGDSIPAVEPSSLKGKAPETVANIFTKAASTLADVALAAESEKALQDAAAETQVDKKKTKKKSS